MSCQFCGNTDTEVKDPRLAEDHKAIGREYSCSACGGGLRLVDPMPLSLLVVLCLTIGLAPYMPEPHLLEPLRLLAAGELVHAADVFELVLHGTPWVLLILKLILSRILAD